MTPDEEAGGTVLGLDNVPLDLSVAHVGTRLLAGFVDYTVVAVAASLWIAAAIALAVWLEAGLPWIVGGAILGLFVLEYGYFAGLEILMEGRTPGKNAFRLRVVMRDGGRPGASAILVRNCVRSVDLLVGVMLMAADPLARRLGDRLADTLVVHLPRPATGLVVHRVPQRWTAEEVALVEAFFRRRPELEPARAAVMARQLLRAVERDDPALLAGAEPAADPAETLRRALAVEAR